jgi:hypothetical protein
VGGHTNSTTPHPLGALDQLPGIGGFVIDEEGKIPKIKDGMSIKDCVGIFTGNPVRDVHGALKWPDPREFMDNFDCICGAKGISGKMKVWTLFLFIKESARSWFITNRLHEDMTKSWKDIRKNFIECFSHGTTVKDIYTQYRECHQGANEPVVTYALRLGELATQLEVTEVDQMTSFVVGLRAGLKERVESDEPETLQKAISKAKKHERIQDELKKKQTEKGSTTMLVTQPQTQTPQPLLPTPTPNTQETQVFYAQQQQYSPPMVAPGNQPQSSRTYPQQTRTRRDLNQTWCNLCRNGSHFTDVCPRRLMWCSRCHLNGHEVKDCYTKMGGTDVGQQQQFNIQQ